MSRRLFFILVFLPSLVLAQDVRITGLSDFSFGLWSGSGDEASEDTVCVYKSSGNKRYYVTASGTGSGGAFQLQNGGNNVDFTVKWRTSTGGLKKLNPGVAKRFGGANKTAEDCGGSDSAAMEISFDENDMGAAVPGSYSGDLTILIEPE